MTLQSLLNMQILYSCFSTKLLPINKLSMTAIAISMTITSFFTSSDVNIAIAQPRTWETVQKTNKYPRSMQNLNGSNWKLNQSNNDRPDTPDVSDNPITIAFTKSSISGFGGCNHFGGTYHRQGDKLTVSDLNSTTRGCQSLIMRREESFLAAIAGIRRVRAIRNRLLLDYTTNSGESGVLEFSRINSPISSPNTPGGNLLPNPSPRDDDLPRGNPGVSE